MVLEHRLLLSSSLRCYTPCLCTGAMEPVTRQKTQSNNRHQSSLPTSTAVKWSSTGFLWALYALWTSTVCIWQWLWPRQYGSINFHVSFVLVLSVPSPYQDLALYWYSKYRARRDDLLPSLPPCPEQLPKCSSAKEKI